MAECEYKKIFAKNLKYYMEQNQKRQIDLMNDLHLSSSTVSNWCAGSKLPRINKIQLLADYFGIHKSDLLEDQSRQDGRHSLNDGIYEIAPEVLENPRLCELLDLARNIPLEQVTAHMQFMKDLKELGF